MNVLTIQIASKRLFWDQSHLCHVGSALNIMSVRNKDSFPDIYAKNRFPCVWVLFKKVLLNIYLLEDASYTFKRQLPWRDTKQNFALFKESFMLLL